MKDTHLDGGFTDPAQDAARAFRGIMQAMARPGTIFDVEGTTPPAPLSVAAGTALLTLCDPDTGLHLAGPCDTGPVRDWLTFHTGAPFVAAEAADFVLGPWDALDLSALRIGTPEYPDRSATVIVEVEALANDGATLRGPGIETTTQLNLPDIAPFQRNADRFPLGLDFLFTCGRRLAALPRSTRVS